MRKQPLLILVLCFIIGIVFQDYFALGFYWVVGLLTILLLATIVLLKSTLNNFKNISILSFYIGLGIFFHYFNTPKVPQIDVHNSNELIFEISKKLNSNEKNKRYEIETEYKNKSIKAILYAPKDFPDLDFVHFYKTSAILREIQPAKYSFQFNYSKYLQRKGIFYSLHLVDVPTAAEKSNISVVDYFKQKRWEVLQKINHSSLSEKTQDFLKGIILADRSEMNPDLVEDFNRSGLTHFLAISGTHVLVIFGMFLFFFQRIFSSKNYKLAVVTSLLLIWLFAFFIGWGSSVVRSCVMVSCYFIFVLLQRSPNLLHSLALSAFLILIIDTQQIFDIGFQLSFSAVFGIYWLNKPIKNLFPDYKTWLGKLLTNVSSLTLSAQLSTLPIVLYNFHQFSLISIFANLFIVPFSEIAIVFSFLMTFLIGLNVQIQPLNFLYDAFVSCLLKIIHWFSEFESVFFSSIPMNIWEVILLIIIIYFLRFLLLKTSYKSFSRFSFAVLLFFSVRLLSNFYEFTQSDVNMYQSNYKDKIFVVREGRSAVFCMENTTDKNLNNYFINPYLNKYRIKNYHIKVIPKGSVNVFYNGHLYSLK